MMPRDDETAERDHKKHSLCGGSTRIFNPNTLLQIKVQLQRCSATKCTESIKVFRQDDLIM